MSISRCEIRGCRRPTMTGVICATHWKDMPALLDRAVEVHADLDGGPAKGGEQVARSTTSPMPVSIPVMDARTALGDALAAALAVICPGVPRLVPVDAVRLLRAHEKRLHGSYAAPLLMEDLTAAIRAAVQAVDIPRGRMSIPGRCRECGPSMLHPVGGMLACDRCDERMTIGEVRHAA